MPNFSNILLATGITLFSLAMARDTYGSPLKEEESTVQKQYQDTSSESIVPEYIEKFSNLKSDNHHQHIKRQWWNHPSNIWA
ncbi:hypothetical protein BDC45DRAFT_498881 [Circinella umbellata]|nr:hypothetical protein BDC45DRAFT_498881 [Circinella umbellata]